VSQLDVSVARGRPSNWPATASYDVSGHPSGMSSRRMRRASAPG
jgi:hypothetical protein